MEQVKPMKLMALDQEDLQIISSMVQDSVLKLADIKYLPAERRLVLTMNRYLWETDENNQKRRMRARSVLSVSRVDAVKAQKINQTNKDMVLSLLCVLFEETNAPAGQLKLEFSGGAAIAANIECIEAQLADLGSVWETESRPEHDLEG
ncbi:hypothetical protein PsW64_00042 [Pseudovibrio sp. W64]|jgi:hypothetical protein|uniref:DUF2948 domain-containing protein n=1 Tax=Pseudovibrio ascidiaceicola TaxID=285279 RepID=A0A1I3WMA3_9HYPH|nr:MULTISPECIES: DUF2948 family protein [Pseudovibrio]KZK85369.1 hypothetical protein PsAD13_01907 [Pseudovibrio sp. Ad13]KZK91634.1 hypothetical protein PsAD46_01861 [Pseudovibrio sp. Ad46]KZK91714.1 hypothetical protein PsW64_00042 [Pseudovibrio sp. W64]KZK97415.1 hypothetical protein PsAD5_02262 [Pseudovibrio sp. Ad5]KZL03527.1 hypothetical protein PsW74_00604 [Pseudovibrio sp. W74]